MYDPRCQELAEVFLPTRDFPGRTRLLTDLSQAIQDAVEAFLEDRAAALRLALDDEP